MSKAEQQWTCLSCGYVYNPAVGEPDDGISPGTLFEDLPDNWTCPECGVHKGNYARNQIS